MEAPVPMGRQILLSDMLIFCHRQYTPYARFFQEDSPEKLK